MILKLKNWFSTKIGLIDNLIEIKEIYRETEKAFLCVLSESKYYRVGKNMILQIDNSVFHNDKYVFGIWIPKSVIINLDVFKNNKKELIK